MCHSRMDVTAVAYLHKHCAYTNILTADISSCLLQVEHSCVFPPFDTLGPDRFTT